jgi:hypothetical protein
VASAPHIASNVSAAAVAEVAEVADVKVPWWKKLFNFLLKYNPLSWFFRWISSKGWIGKFINWIREKVSPATWGLVKDAAARGAMSAVGGAGSALVQKFMETKDGKWDKALTGQALPTNGMFQGGNVVPVNRTTSSFGYGSGVVQQPAYQQPSEAFPFGT